MSYNYITKHSSPNYTKGRRQPISKIVIHWWGNPAEKPTASGVVNWLCNPKAQVSAHYVVSGTNREVYHLVNNWDTAWHAKSGNEGSIGIELDPRCRDEDYDVAGELIAEIWKHYGKLPIFPHKKYVQTACPGHWDLDRLAKVAESKMGNVKPVNPAPVPEVKPQPAPPAQNSTVYGYGYITHSPVIGSIAKFLRTNYPAYTPASALGNYWGKNIQSAVKEFQRRTGLVPDGFVSTLTLNKLKQLGWKG